EPHRIGRPNRVGIEARSVSEAAGPSAPVPEVNGDAVVWMAGHLEHGPPNGASGMSQLDAPADDLSVLASLERRCVAEAEPIGCGGAHQHGVVPRQLRNRLRKFLQPAVVRKSAVENRWIVLEAD